MVSRSSCTMLSFQPTRPLRGATRWFNARLMPHEHFNPRAPCGARPFAVEAVDGVTGFQPTRPLRGATLQTNTRDIIDAIFQPTRPLRGATYQADIAKYNEAFQPTRPLRGATSVSGGQT